MGREVTAYPLISRFSPGEAGVLPPGVPVGLVQCPQDGSLGESSWFAPFWLVRPALTAELVVSSGSILLHSLGSLCPLCTLTLCLEGEQCAIGVAAPHS